LSTSVDSCDSETLALAVRPSLGREQTNSLHSKFEEKSLQKNTDFGY